MKKEKQITTKPNCPKCGKPMRTTSTGSMVRTFYCPDCKEMKIVKREEALDEKGG
jgi:predicted RNA-binding Zn-ribbon protein involved in translation (DUF1610 family)